MLASIQEASQLEAAESELVAIFDRIRTGIRQLSSCPLLNEQEKKWYEDEVRIIDVGTLNEIRGHIARLLDAPEMTSTMERLLGTNASAAGDESNKQQPADAADPIAHQLDLFESYQIAHQRNIDPEVTVLDLKTAPTLPKAIEIARRIMTQSGKLVRGYSRPAVRLVHFQHSLCWELNFAGSGRTYVQTNPVQVVAVELNNVRKDN